MLGLETEYALVFSPDVGSPVPVQEKVFEALSEVLRREHLCLEAAYRKGGFFLANGGLFHYEAQPEAVQRGLLEMATPECATVVEAVAYHRAQERLIVRLLPAIDAKLRADGFAGQLVVGKHSSDYEGHTFGTHENYLVLDRRGPLRTLALVVILAALHLVRLPLTLAMLVLQLIATAACLAQFVYLAAMLAARRGPAQPEDAPPPLPVRALQKVLDATNTVASKVAILDLKYLLPPFSRLASRLVLPVFRTHLVPFLVTRLVFTGPGWLKTDRPEEGARFVLSPKAAAIGAVMEVFQDTQRKPIVDIKNLFRGALTPLALQKRLHISYSDTNMSEWALWLKLGTTELVIRMLEDGYLPEGVELEDPLAALAVVNADLTFRRPLVPGTEDGPTALDIQRRYLETARRYLAERRPEDGDARRLLAAWEQCLRALPDDPKVLADRLDWVCKKDLMDEAVQSVGWSAIARVLPAIRYLEERNVGAGRLVERPEDVDRVLSRAGEDARGLEERLTAADLRVEQLSQLSRTFYQLKKIDLRYHEVSIEGGYYQQLEAEGMFCRVVTDEQIERAIQHPPENTRGRLRGHYVREAARLGLVALVGWERIILPTRFTVIPMPDATSDKAPIELSELKNEGFWRTCGRALTFLPHLVAPY